MICMSCKRLWSCIYKLYNFKRWDSCQTTISGKKRGSQMKVTPLASQSTNSLSWQLLCSFHQADLLQHHVNPPFCFGTSKEKMPPNIFTFLSISFPGPSIWVDKNCLGFFDAGIFIRIAFGLRIFKDRADRAHLMGTGIFSGVDSQNLSGKNNINILSKKINHFRM